ncbi:hypothetical protein J2Z48_001608 [Croceifilum oryzae]|uniref:Uncharacterized protein n=1 Tax=Croceifilum oryzae TaxID=1553429 RepID=A0AAJ1TMH9_9BACL|nr:hypothetical protein [Croceifilum oryzae]MDQ0417435.1 hypothetical protein [Croceifilum oryzae]
MAKSFHSQFVKRFQVEDEIQFSSGKILQARTHGGKRVFLQSIPIEGQTLPEDFRELVLKFQHPHLAPIIDVMVDEHEVILVHAPFTGEPLPLLVTKERPMKPLKALKVAKSLLQTIRELQRRNFPLRTTLDPKNILLSGSEPLLLFYYLHDEVKVQRDQKWRDLLFFLLTGYQPSKNPKNNKLFLENNLIPRKLQKLALKSWKTKVSLEEVIGQVDKLLKDRSLESGRNPGGLRKVIMSTAVALILIATGALVGNYYLSQSDAKDPVKSEQRAIFQIKPNGKKHDFASKSEYAFDSMEESTVLQGELAFDETFDDFKATMEKSDGGRFELLIKRDGQISSGSSQGARTTMFGAKGVPFIKAGKSYEFYVYHTSLAPVRVKIVDKETKEAFVLRGNSQIQGTLKPVFTAGKGVTLQNPGLQKIDDTSQVDSDFLPDQPWILNTGIGIAKGSDLTVMPKTQIAIPISSSFTNFLVGLSQDSTIPFEIKLNSVDGITYVVEWSNGKVSLLRNSGTKITEMDSTSIPKLVKNKPIGFSLNVTNSDMVININQGTEVKATLGLSEKTSLSLRDLFIDKSTQPYKLLEK